jgi:hypothetical protein
MPAGHVTLYAAQVFYFDTTVLKGWARENLIIIDADFLNYCSIIHLLTAITTQVMVQGDK